MTATVRGISAEGRSGSITRKNEREYTVVYLVYTDDRDDGPRTVSQAFGIPSIGDMYTPGNDHDPRAIVVDKRATQRESPFEWEVEVVYSTDIGEKPDEEEHNLSPLDEPAEVSFGFQARTVVIPGRYNDPGNPDALRNLELSLTNSYGDPFDPAPEMEVYDPVLNVVRNYANVSAAYLMSIANTVNAVDYYGCDARQLRLAAPEAQRQYDADFGFYWRVAFQFLYRYETWDFQLLNKGQNYLTDGGAFGILHLPFEDDRGNRRIGLLTTAGYAINDSSTPADRGRYVAGGDSPTYQRYRVYREIDFNSLGII